MAFPMQASLQINILHVFNGDNQNRDHQTEDYQNRDHQNGDHQNGDQLHGSCRLALTSQHPLSVVLH